jgi:Concanavalin A-like lectin/glucanases superfamily
MAGAAALLALLAGAIAWQNAGSRNAQRKSGPAAPCTAAPATPPSDVTDAYDRQVLSLRPVMYLTMGHPSARTEQDLSGNGHPATYRPADDPPGQATLPNGDTAAQFNGLGQYAQVPSAPALSVVKSGCLTVQAWVRPAVLQFPRSQGSGYVYILGKGTPGKQEYAMRMYSESNNEVPPRPNRISAYGFNLAGGLGSGAYFQDEIKPGAWLMVTFVLDDIPSPAWPAGYISIYKNGDLRGQVSLSQFNVTPGASTAPFAIATRNLDSYFDGAIGKVAVYDHVLTGAQINATYRAMTQGPGKVI